MVVVGQQRALPVTPFLFSQGKASQPSDTPKSAPHSPGPEEPQQPSPTAAAESDSDGSASAGDVAASGLGNSPQDRTMLKYKTRTCHKFQQTGQPPSACMPCVFPSLALRRGSRVFYFGEGVN